MVLMNLVEYVSLSKCIVPSLHGKSIYLIKKTSSFKPGTRPVSSLTSVYVIIPQNLIILILLNLPVSIT